MNVTDIANGSLFSGFFSTLESTFLGSYVYLILLVLIDFMILAKSRNMALVAIMNIVLISLFSGYIPAEAAWIVVAVSIFAIGFYFFGVFR
jgi:hypothetical protein